MSSPTHAVDVAPPRPGLALLLAVLGLPGVTIAWGLPAGGFWIGMPLAIAAIVVASRTRGRTDRRGRAMAVTAMVLAGAEILLTVVWTAFG